MNDRTSSFQASSMIVVRTLSALARQAPASPDSSRASTMRAPRSSATWHIAAE